jgi:hypothetical protein
LSFVRGAGCMEFVYVRRDAAEVIHASGTKVERASQGHDESLLPPAVGDPLSSSKS